MNNPDRLKITGDVYEALIKGKTNKIVEYYSGLADELYSNSLKENFSFDNIHMPDEFNDDVYLNRYGFRSGTFESKMDLVIGGCSVTRGTGISTKNMWATIVEQSTGLKTANLSIGGQSVSNQVRTIFAFIKKFGNPKYIYCLFPDFERIEIPTNRNLMITHRYDKNKEVGPILHPVFILKKRNKSSIHKTPLIADEALNPEIGHFYSAQYINILSQYCEATGIKFAWSTWIPEMQYIINKFKNEEYFNNTIDVESDRWIYNEDSKVYDYYSSSILDKDPGMVKKIVCHQDIRESEPEEFELGRDRYKYGDRAAHWGLHRNLHIAEIVIKHINNDWIDNES